MKRLFLDDIRVPTDCITYMHSRIGDSNKIYLEDWDIAKDYSEFVEYIEKNGVPDIISFDHDLSDEYYESNDVKNYKEKTGYDCAKWLCEYCLENKIPLPEYIVHSMNPIGSENILSVFKTCEKMMKKGES